jgi:hypothetical protein
MVGLVARELETTHASTEQKPRLLRRQRLRQYIARSTPIDACPLRPSYGLRWLSILPVYSYRQVAHQDLCRMATHHALVRLPAAFRVALGAASHTHFGDVCPDAAAIRSQENVKADRGCSHRWPERHGNWTPADLSGSLRGASDVSKPRDHGRWCPAHRSSPAWFGATPSSRAADSHPAPPQRLRMPSPDGSLSTDRPSVAYHSEKDESGRVRAAGPELALVALAGTGPVSVTSEGDPVQDPDLLVSSSTRTTPRDGAAPSHVPARW